MSRLIPRAALWFALLCIAAPTLAVPTAANCPGRCVSAASIVHAAGVPPGVHQALEKIGFDGIRLADGAKEGLAQLATEAKALPAKAVVTISVAADKDLAPSAAARQAAARVQALSAGLKQAGVLARQFKLKAGS